MSYEPKIGFYMMESATSGAEAVVAHVSPDQHPATYRTSFDAAATCALLRAAIDAISTGDGLTAVAACGAAWFRLAAFHKS